MDTSETNTAQVLQGDLIVTGTIHGHALNCTVVPYEDPKEWFMVQFVSQQQLDDYARDNLLLIQDQRK